MATNPAVDLAEFRGGWYQLQSNIRGDRRTRGLLRDVRLRRFPGRIVMRAWTTVKFEGFNRWVDEGFELYRVKTYLPAPNRVDSSDGSRVVMEYRVPNGAVLYTLILHRPTQLPPWHESTESPA